MRSWTGILDECLLSLPLYLRLLIIAAFLIIMAVIARKRRFLTLSGSVMSMVIGAVVFYIGGVSGIVMLLFFFLSGFSGSFSFMKTPLMREKMDFLSGSGGIPPRTLLISVM